MASRVIAPRKYAGRIGDVAEARLSGLTFARSSAGILWALALAPLLVASAEAQNLLLNPDFDHGLESWFSAGTTFDPTRDYR